MALIDTIVFADQSGAEDPVLWAHELQHIEQYREWGVQDFAIRYIRSYNSIENDAYAREERFAALYFPGAGQSRQFGAAAQPPAGQVQQHASPPVTCWPPPASFCATQRGTCPLMALMPAGQYCECHAPQGIFPGISQ